MPSSPDLAGLPFGWGAVVSLLNLCGFGGIATVWIKNRAAYRTADADADQKLRSEMWRDIEALKLSKDDVSRRLTLAEAKIASQTIQLGQQRFVLVLVIDELERVSPGNVVARQARVLLRDIQPAAIPTDEEIAPMVEAVTKADCAPA